MTLDIAPAAAGHGFGTAPAFRVGVEEELFLVDPVSRAPLECTDEVLGCESRFSRGRVQGEMCDGVVELATTVCEHAGSAVRGLASLRRDVVSQGAAALLGVGVHPTAAFADVTHRPGAHYDAVSASTRGLLRQTVCCGAHVHVGMPDPETAVTTFNAMRKWAPLLLALSANSPFWHGRDSGLQSARTIVYHTIPRSGMPRAFRDWADYQASVAELCRAAEVEGDANIWWDMRLHRTLGTLELRLLDAQSSLRDMAGLIALVHCLVRHEALTALPGEDPSPEVLSESTFRALRDGLDARLWFGGRMRHVRDLAREAAAMAADHAPSLDCVGELAEVERMLAEGNGAVRQRAAHARGGMPAVLELLARETAN